MTCAYVSLRRQSRDRSEGGRGTVAQKVLIIDDSEMIHGLIRARLKDEPVELLFAADGVRGLQMASEHAPDLEHLDVDMPEHDGFEDCRRQKADPETLE